MNVQTQQMTMHIHKLLADVEGHENSALHQNNVAFKRKTTPSSRRRIAPKESKVVKNTLPVKADQPGRVVRPEEILPLEKGKFKDF